MRELDELTELTARRLSQTYEEQLGFIPSDSAWLLGECAIKEIVALLWSSDGAQGMAIQDETEAERLARVFVCHVTRIESETDTEQQGKALMNKINDKITKSFKKIWDKVNRPFTFNTGIPTTTNEKWTADGIFHRSGMVVREGGKSLTFYIFLFYFNTYRVCAKFPFCVFFSHPHPFSPRAKVLVFRTPDTPRKVRIQEGHEGGGDQGEAHPHAR
jgi:hypothetical protein